MSKEKKNHVLFGMNRTTFQTASEKELTDFIKKETGNKVTIQRKLLLEHYGYVDAELNGTAAHFAFQF